MWTVIPVKPFAYAKQRLAAVLTDTERATLARVMLQDLLATLARCSRVTGVLVVSQEATIHELAARAGASVLPEEMRGLSRAVTQAGLHLLARGETRMLMLPGDVPLATPYEIDTIIMAHSEAPHMTIVSDREGFGTNALAVSSPDLIPFHFGHESFHAHCAAARDIGAAVRILQLPGIAFDIDTPDDLRDLMSFDTEAETLVYLCDRGLDARIPSRQHQAAAW
ncbi:MAG: 2-phospho-L-lactate guanylyltransferase [Gammaproteobacteria bacterium]|nr:2-phospho-L-lactate guanylyltransferase [Gammaproteobacteria bacterium]